MKKIDFRVFVIKVRRMKMSLLWKCNKLFLFRERVKREREEQSEVEFGN